MTTTQEDADRGLVGDDSIPSSESFDSLYALEILFDMPASDVTHSYIVLRSPCLKTEEKAVLRVACFPVMQFCNDNFVILSGHADVHDHSAIS